MKASMDHGSTRMMRSLAVVLPAFLMVFLATGCHQDPNVRKHKYLESGRRYEKDGKLREAAIQVSNSLKVDRNFSEAHYELAKIYLKLGSIKEGYAELMRTVDLSPTNLEARTDLGGIFLMGNDPARAEEQAKSVLAIDANNPDAYALLSAVSARRGDRVAALANIQKAISIKPDQASYHTTLALLENSDPAKSGHAEEELQKAIKLDQKDTHAHLVLAALMEKRGDKQGAEQQYLAAIQQDPKQLQARTALAGLYLRAGDKAKGEQVLRKAVEDLNENQDATEVLKEYYFRSGQPDSAESVFADLASKYPKSFPIKMAYASVLAARGEFAKVQPVADQLTKSNPNQPQVQLLRAAVLLNENKVDEALTLIQNATKATPDNAQLQIALAKIAERKGDFTLAETSFNAADRVSPGNLEVQSGLAALASRRNDSVKLAQIASKTIALRPDFSEAYLWRGMAEANLKQYDTAEADIQNALTKNPNNSIVLRELGLLRMRQGRIPEATTLLERAVEKNPNEVQATEQLVANDYAAKQPDKALSRVQAQLQRAPQNAALYGLLSNLQLQKKDFNSARDSAKKAMELDPADRGAVRLYSQAVAMNGDKDEAIRAWQNWLSTHPKDAEANSIIGTFEDAKGDSAKAAEFYKKALQINTTEPIASNNLAYLMVTSGQNADVALSYAQTARRLLPNSPNTADTLAWVYFYKGTYSSARDLLEAAVKQDPESASIHYHLGMTYSKLGNKPEAMSHLKKAVALDPNSQNGKDASAELAKLG